MVAKNVETKCEGLSLALFIYAIAGNLTFALSICVISMEGKHLLVNASWLAGSFFFSFAAFCRVLWLIEGMMIVGSTLTILFDLFVSRPMSARSSFERLTVHVTLGRIPILPLSPRTYIRTPSTRQPERSRVIFTSPSPRHHHHHHHQNSPS